MPTSYLARKSTLVLSQHHWTAKRWLTYVCELSRCPCFSGKWTRTCVLSHYNYMGWLKPWREKRVIGFHLDTTGHTKVTKLKRNSLLDRVMNLKDLTWLLATSIFSRCILHQAWLKLRWRHTMLLSDIQIMSIYQYSIVCTSRLVLEGKRYHAT